MHPGQRPNIGITFFASQNPRHSIWSNGTLQNVIFLLLMLRASGQAGELWLINGGDTESIPTGLGLAGLDLKLVRFSEVADRLDVLIEAGAQIQPEQARQVRRQGGVVIAYRCGNDYIMDAERICFDLQPGSLFNGTRFDEVWTQPQHEAMCRSYWEIGLRAPVRIMPHIWSPLFIERAVRELSLTHPDAVFGYVPHSGPRRIGIFEPNLNVVKTFLTPLLIAEAAWREDPTALAEVHVTNSQGLTEHPTFKHMVRAMDIFRHNILSFEARSGLPVFLSRFTDIVVSHQWENGLNYLYYDVLYGDYPLVHNSPFLREVGYYYEDFDASQGARALLRAIRTHDANLTDYRTRTQSLLARVDINNSEIQHTHMARILALLAAS